MGTFRHNFYRSPHFCFPWRRPCDYHAICYTILKSMRKSKNRNFYHIFVFPGDAPGAIRLNVVWMERESLQIVSLHVPIYVLPFLRNSEIFVKKIVILSYPIDSTPPLGWFPSEYRPPLWDGKTRMVSLSDGEEISKISLFVLT